MLECDNNKGQNDDLTLQFDLKSKEEKMNTEWMGRYRPLLAALVRHSNITQRSSGTRTMLTDEISLNAQEWQVFEYIIEHMEDDAYMN